MSEQPAAVSGAWTADDTFTAKVWFTETPFVATIRLKFSEDEARFESDWNVGFGQTKEAVLVGKTERSPPGGHSVRLTDKSAKPIKELLPA